MDTGQEEGGIRGQVQGQARLHQIKFTSFLLWIRIETIFERDQRRFVYVMTSNPTSDLTIAPPLLNMQPLKVKSLTVV